MKTRLITLLVCVIFLCGEASANTRFAFGTIAGVTEKGEVIIFLECGNGVGGWSWEHKRFWPVGHTRHGDKFWMLDGENVSWQEAAKPGRPVTVVNELAFIVSSTVPGWEGVEPAADGNNSLFLFDVGNYGATFDILDRQGKVSKTKQIASGMQLLVDVHEGQAGAVAAICNLSYRPCEEVQVETVSMKDGVLQGTVQVTVRPNTKNRRLPDGQESVKLSYSFAVRSDDKGVVSGEWWRGEGKHNAVKGQLLTRPKTLPQRKRVWLRIGDLPPNFEGHGFVVFDLDEAGKNATHVRVLHSKAKPISQISANTLQFDGSTLKGEITGTIQGWSVFDGTLTFEGKLMGNRYLFGSYTVADKAGKVLATNVFHGGFGHQDGPDLAGDTEEHKAMVKEFGKRK